MFLELDSNIPRPRINRLCMPNFLVGLLNAVQVIEILWFKNLNSWSLLLIWGREHGTLKMFLNQKYIYEILIGSCEKAKVSCTGQPASVLSIYSWSRQILHTREVQDEHKTLNVGSKWENNWNQLSVQKKEHNHSSNCYLGLLGRWTQTKIGI